MIQDQIRRFFLVSFLLLVFIKNSIIYIIITSFEQIQNEYFLSKTQLGLITTLYYLFAFMGSIIWTILFERLSRVSLLMIGATFWSFGVIFLSFNLSYNQILIAISFIGIGSECFTIISINSFLDLAKKNAQGKAFSFFISFQGLGAIFGILFTGILEGSYSVIWNDLILYLGMFNIIIISTIILLWRKIAKKINEESNEFVQESVSEIPLLRKTHIDSLGIRKTFHNKANLYLFILFIILFPIHTFNNIWIQKYWIEEHGLSQIMASISLIFTSGGEFFGIMFAGWFTDRFNNQSDYRKPIFGAISLLISVPFFLIGFILSWTLPSTSTENMNFVEICWFLFISAIQNPTIFLSYTSLLLAFFFSQIMGSLFFILISDCNPKETRSLALNISLVLYNIALFIGPILGGYIGDLYGLTIVFIIVPITFFCCGLILMKIRKYLKESYQIVHVSENQSED